MSAIEIQGVSQRFGSVQAVRDLSFTVDAGRVTGFLGPNGAGKSTTLRMLLGLIHSDAGAATFDGRAYSELEHPSARVGAVLEQASFHPGRSGRNHLRVLAAAGRHPDSRVHAGIAALGVGLGAIVRNQVVAIVGLLVVSFAIEPLLIGLAPGVGRFGPFGPLPTVAAGLTPEEAGMPADTDLLAPGIALLLLLVWIGSAFAAGVMLLRVRDLE